MKVLNFNLADTTKARYLQLADAIRESIKSGKLLPGERLPSARALAEQTQSNRHTIMAAYNELIAEGWIAAKQRRFYFVESSLPIGSSQKSTANTAQYPPFHWQTLSPTLDISEKPAREFRYNFTGGQPDTRLFPYNEFKSYLADAVSRAQYTNMSYGNHAGHPPLIEQIETYLRRMRSITGKAIVIVNGSQEALHIMSQLMLQQGDCVAVEKLGYQPAWQSFRHAGATLIGINQDKHGIDPEHLRLCANKQKIKLLYLTPLHQYPTTNTLSVSRRMQILDIARQYNIGIIEDDYDHEFHYRCQPLAPMAADDPSGQVAYLSTFSKIMFPAIRIGFMAVDRKLLPDVLKMKCLINHKTNTLLQDAVARWMQSGDFERYLRRVTRQYLKRRDSMASALSAIAKEQRPLDFNIPDGGMAFWLDLKTGAKALRMKAADKGIYIQSEEQFHLIKRENQDRFIRLGFAGLDQDEQAEGLDLLFNSNS